MSGISGASIADHPNEQVQFYWAVPHADRYDYHWLRACARLHGELWAGAALESADVPPTDAVDAGPTVAHLLRDGNHRPGSRIHPSARVLASDEWPTADSSSGGWLCRLCRLHYPGNEERRLKPDDCRACGCDGDIHATWVLAASPFSRGCGMAWVDAIYDSEGEAIQVGLVHCPCPGYSPADGPPPVFAEGPSTLFDAAEPALASGAPGPIHSTDDNLVRRVRDVTGGKLVTAPMDALTEGEGGLVDRLQFPSGGR